MSRTSAASQRDTLLASLAVAVCGTMWGGFWYPLRWLESQGTGGGWVSLTFFAVSTITILPWIVKQGWRHVDPGRQMITGALLGTAYTLYTISLVMTDVIHAILLFYLTPVWSTLASIALLGERLTVGRALALLLGFAGMAFILGFEDGFPLPRNSGDLVALASGMLWAAGTLRSYRYPSQNIAWPTFAFSVGGLISSALILVPALQAGSPLADMSGMPDHFIWTVLLALVVFVPPNFLVLWAAQRIDSGRVGILLTTEVLFGAVTAAMFSGEPFGTAEIVGTVLIVCAALIEVLRR